MSAEDAKFVTFFFSRQIWFDISCELYASRQFTGNSKPYFPKQESFLKKIVNYNAKYTQHLKN